VFIQPGDATAQLEPNSCCTNALNDYIVVKYIEKWREEKTTPAGRLNTAVTRSHDVKSCGVEFSHNNPLR
jgi:hypothetical protein